MDGYQSNETDSKKGEWRGRNPSNPSIPLGLPLDESALVEQLMVAPERLRSIN
jgi:hypothetical protein